MPRTLEIVQAHVILILRFLLSLGFLPFALSTFLHACFLSLGIFFYLRIFLILCSFRDRATMYGLNTVHLPQFSQSSGSTAKIAYVNNFAATTPNDFGVRLNDGNAQYELYEESRHRAVTRELQVLTSFKPYC
jgi:hypothetical protein